MLTDLGLDGSADDVKAFRYLASVPSASTRDIADALGCPLATAEGIVERLATHGLMAPVSGGEGRWAALPPEIALGPRLTRLRESTRRAEVALAELGEAYRRERGSSPSDLVEYIDGPAQAQRLLEIQSAAKESLWAFQTGTNTVTSVASTVTMEPAAPPGLENRVIVDSEFLTEPEAVRALNDRLSLGHQVRVVDHPLMKLAIADRSVALVRTSPQRTMMIRQPLVVLACELFEATWRRARPYLRDDSGLEPLDRQILQLMLSGLTDTATAHQIGTSPRTVQRRLRALMDTARVTSRLQLAWHALRNSWI
ncbi:MULTISPECIES: LuxR family transcriptional regulator [Streptacidiphilus]|uniref:LuxR family transcriptional regulator n=2 Tax=Streptacidiphilus TaxID=228398 RepID=A0ABV6V0M5_9ACTN|nr:LuxR family transcriptional regulator [Streptacidiphilus jeojiense]